MKRTLLSIILTAIFTVCAVAQEVVVNDNVTYPLAKLLSCTPSYDEVSGSVQGLFLFSDGTQLTITDLKTISFASSIGSGLNQLDSQTSVSVYPNPTTDFLIIDNATQGLMSVYNLSGSLVMQTTISNGQNQVPVGQLQEGIYLLQINNQVFKLNKK